MLRSFKKLVSLVLVLALSLAISLPAFADTNAKGVKDSGVKDSISIGDLVNSINISKYVKNYIKKVDFKEVEIEKNVLLYNLTTNLPFCTCFTFKEGGYAIVDNNSLAVYEHSLSGSEPYKLTAGEVGYYTGICSYLKKNISNKLYQLMGNTSIVKSNDAVKASAQEFYNSLPYTDSNKVKLRYSTVMKSTTAREPESGSLNGSLSTDYVNGYCGPTSIYLMLNYKGIVNGGTSTIYTLSNFIGDVSLSNLVHGTNQYLSEIGSDVRVASKSYYNFNFVKSQIDADNPLTLGTSGGGLTTGGHVQTIHGYEYLYYNRSEQNYTLYVNNSWGENNVEISYENTTPSYLKDHVYFH